ncbi:shikimate kinase [Georgenia sp. SUBG003]|uniref:shikimate kinase n=1 Tax=Georgenia sp. SUBG003 TaxID=1497974 RepID=UPI000A50A75F
MSTTRPRVVLVGLPGAGKTTVGRLLADALGVGFVDTDIEVERVAGTSVPEYFRAHGEASFRELEHDVVVRMLTEHGGVLALGGGAVLHPGTQEALRGHTVVLLDVVAERALARVALSGERPLLAGDRSGRFATLRKERLPVYERVATLTVSTSDRRPQDVAAEVLRAVTARDDSAVPDSVLARLGSAAAGPGRPSSPTPHPRHGGRPATTSSWGAAWTTRSSVSWAVTPRGRSFSTPGPPSRWPAAMRLRSRRRA